MSHNTQPNFIIGTGRSGTRSMFRMLSGTPNTEIHHEYSVNEIQKISALYYMKLIDKSTVLEAIRRNHASAVHYSTANTWIDSSNKLSWIIKPLHEIFPQSRFLAIIRDGRKVVSSFYYKLREEMYDDESVQILSNWIDDPINLPSPPPEKRYWWNIPQKNQLWHKEFNHFDRLQRVAWHWSECNRSIISSFSNLPDNQVKVVKLEDLTSNIEILKDTLDFLNIPYDESYFTYLQTPKNVFFPLDFQLTKPQLEKFWPICGDMMNFFGYNKKDVYNVKY